MTSQQLTAKCQSCGMPVERGDYCQYCTDDRGNLLGFDETFERFVRLAMSRDAALDRATAEADTLTYMRGMPAWREHPRLTGDVREA